MNTIHSKTAVMLFVLVAFTTLSVLTPAGAKTPSVDPAAFQILQRMTDFLSEQKQFSLHTQTTYEDTLASGQRVDYDISANVIVSRPNKIHSERIGEQLSQFFYYDGKTLTLFNPSAKVYATQAAPGTIEELLDYAREELGLFVPVSDLVYRYAFHILTQDINSAIVVGKTDINGVSCNHLAFSRPDVDFQVWVADGDQPLPCKYVVTDTTTPEQLSVSTVMSDWNVAPATMDSMFEFVPPKDANKIDFMPLDSAKSDR